MKRFVWMIALLVLCIIGIGGTYAYSTVFSKAHNIITTGGIKIAVEEWQQRGETVVPYPKEPVAVMPGRTVSKIVTVRNLDKACYVRARMEATVIDPEGREVQLSHKEMQELLQLDINEDIWKQKEEADAWWYYTLVVSEKGVTEPLFESVTFAGKNMGNRYQGCNIQIRVLAQAVQSANNAATALSAVGWPEE